MNKPKEKKGLHFELVPVIFALAWPTMLEELMGTAVQYIDTAMVGTLGTAATAAVGSTATINWLMNGTASALGVGFLSYISRALGAEDRERARRASAQSVMTALICGIVFTALTLSLSRRVPVWMKVDPSIRELASRYFFIIYLPMLFRTAASILGSVLRSAGDSKTPMRTGVCANLINIVLNFLLIYPTRTVGIFGVQVKLFGAGLGVLGAAAASAVAYTFNGCAITVALFRHPAISPRGYRMLPDRSILRPCLRVALPNMLQRFCTSLGYVVFASMINALGELSTAAHTVANTVESAFYIPGYGMLSAAATLTGNAIGAGKKEQLQNMSRMLLVLELGMMLVTGALLYFFAPAAVSIFSADVAVIALGSRVLRMVALSEPFYGASIVTEGMLMGAGQTAMPFLFNTLAMWGIRILGTFLCIRVWGLGLVSAWACMIADNMTLLVFFRLYFRFGKWRDRLFPAAGA